MEDLIAIILFLTVVAVIFVYAFIMPESKYKTLSPFSKFLSDTFNFRTLWLESILKFFYVFMTVFVVVFGVVAFFANLDYASGTAFVTLLVSCFIGPIVVRLVFEGSMMLILLVKNVMQINKRLMENGLEDREPVVVKRESVMSHAPSAEFSTVPPVANNNNNNSQPQPKKVCRACNTPLSFAGAEFCPNCGSRVD